MRNSRLRPQEAGDLKIQVMEGDVMLWCDRISTITCFPVLTGMPTGTNYTLYLFLGNKNTEFSPDGIKSIEYLFTEEEILWRC